MPSTYVVWRKNANQEWRHWKVFIQNILCTHEKIVPRINQNSEANNFHFITLVESENINQILNEVSVKQILLSFWKQKANIYNYRTEIF